MQIRAVVSAAGWKETCVVPVGEIPVPPDGDIVKGSVDGLFKGGTSEYFFDEVSPFFV